MRPSLPPFVTRAARHPQSCHWVRSAAPAWLNSRNCAAHRRAFGQSPALRIQERAKSFDTLSAADSSYSQPATNLSQEVTSAEENHFERVEAESHKLQARSPWMHDGSDVPPVERHRSAGAMTKGKLLTTPSRMLKLILPLTTRDANHDRKDVEPLALLVHPQQPLSYLERLIQSEIPLLPDERAKGQERPPKIIFRAQDSMDEQVGRDSDRARTDTKREDLDRTAPESEVSGADSQNYESTKGEASASETASTKDQASINHPDASQDPDHLDFVRWNPSTEIGDFIRDAAQTKEFAVDIEGAPESIYVGVPSFADRTFYLRMRLRKTARRISEMADIKRECDRLAQLSARRLGQGGFMGLVTWWGVVYYLTFKTDLGWDVMEPITYLVSLSGLIGGYIWFLYHNQEVSYRSAMNFTVSRRQSRLYELKGFDLQRWEMLMEEGNRLRREIKMVADEYDVEWNETKDEGDKKVQEALRKDRKKQEREREKKKEEADDDDDK